MAKRKQQETQTSGAPMIVLIAGGLLVAALVVWALTRSVEPAPTAATTETVPATPGSPTTAANSTAPLSPGSFSLGGETQEPDKAAVARMSVEDLKPKFDRGEVTIIDVRDKTSYENGHIPGALHMQLASIQGMVDMIPKGKPIVTYCT